MATQFQILEAATSAALKILVEAQQALGWTVVGFQVDANPNYDAATTPYAQGAPKFYAALTK